LINDPFQNILFGLDFPGVNYDYRSNYIPNKTGVIISLFSTFTFFSMSMIKSNYRYNKEDFEKFKLIKIKPYLVVVFFFMIFIPFGFFGASGIIQNISNNLLGRFNGLSFTDASLGTNTPLISLFSTLIPLGIFVLYLNFNKSSKKIFTGILFFIPFIAYVFTGGRSGVIMIITSIMIFQLFNSSAKIPIFKLSLVVIASYVLISLQVSSRYNDNINFQRGGLTGSDLNKEVAFIAQKFGETTNFTNAENIIEKIILPIPQTFFLFVTNPIPRIIWKNKPYDKTFATYNYMRTGNDGLGLTTNVTASIPGRYYLKYGYIGVIEIALVFGLIWGLFCKKIINNYYDPSLSIFYIIGISILFVSIREFTAGKFYPLLGAYLIYNLNKQK
jgi:oligosaccharide repeat unit polymerase